MLRRLYQDRLVEVLREHDGRRCPSLDRLGALIEAQDHDLRAVINDMVLTGDLIRLAPATGQHRRYVLACPDGTWETN